MEGYPLLQAAENALFEGYGLPRRRPYAKSYAIDPALAAAGSWPLKGR